jgi:hypothetical protein
MPRGRKKMSDEHKAKIQEARKEAATQKSTDRIILKNGYITKDSNGWTLSVNGNKTYHSTFIKTIESIKEEYLKNSTLSSFDDVKKILELVLVEYKKIYKVFFNIGKEEDK